jgi:hypothetical protein
LSTKTLERLSRVHGEPSRSQISDLEGAVDDLGRVVQTSLESVSERSRAAGGHGVRPQHAAPNAVDGWYESPAMDDLE